MRTWTLFIERTKPETVYDIKFGPTADCIQVEVIDKSTYDELKAKLEQAKRIAMDCQNAESYARRLWHEEATELKLLAVSHSAKLAEAYQYLREGKAAFSPNTTNSFVDDWLKWYEARAALNDKND